MRLRGKTLLLAGLSVWSSVWAQNAPTITLAANAEGGNPVIAPNTWVEIKGQNLSRSGDSRIWQSTDFVNGQMPISLDGVSVTVNGKAAFLYYISPTQVNFLTPPDTMPASVNVVVTNNGSSSQPFLAPAQALSRVPQRG
ncbi:MAG: IPT/TIG domain-containing protein [Bryobacteraceae bacterium]